MLDAVIVPHGCGGYEEKVVGVFVFMDDQGKDHEVENKLCAVFLLYKRLNLLRAFLRKDFHDIFRFFVVIRGRMSLFSLL